MPDVHWISLLPAMEGLIVPSKFYGIAAAGRPVLFVGDPVGVGESEALAEWILQLTRAEARRTRWGCNARALLQKRFDRAIALERWEREVLSLPPSGGFKC